MTDFLFSHKRVYDQLFTSVFSYRVTFKKFSVRGNKVNGKWTGGFGMLQRSEIDLIGDTPSMTLERSEVGNYLTPLYTSK